MKGQKNPSNKAWCVNGLTVRSHFPVSLERKLSPNLETYKYIKLLIVGYCDSPILTESFDHSCLSLEA